MWQRCCGIEGARAASDAAVERDPASSPLGEGGFADWAADDSWSSPLTAVGLGENSGSLVMAECGGREPSVAWPAVRMGDKCLTHADVRTQYPQSGRGHFGVVIG